MYHAKSTKFLTFSFFCVLKLSQFYASSTDRELYCNGNLRTCQDILNDEVIRIPTCAKDSSQNVFSTFSIDDTQILQPWITLTANPDTLLPESEEIVSGTRRGYVIGYRDCTVSTRHCYVYRDSLPRESNNWIHTIRPKNDENDLSPGEQCTFFGCVLHTFVDKYDPLNCTRRVLQDFLNETITIVATCPDPGVSVENGSFSITFPPGRTEDVYVEGTVVNVTCDEGFVATYGGVSECQRDGNWTTLPTCEKQCEDLGTKYIDGGMLNISDTTHKVNTTITVICYNGYYRGGGTITCGENGNWSSPTLPPCYPVLCYGSLDNAVVRGQYPVEVNSTVEVICKDGFSGGGTIKCGPHGNWTTALPQCHPRPIIYVVTVVLTLLLISVVVVIFIICYKLYWRYRNDKIRKFNLYFNMEARKESLDATYVPIDLHKRKKISITLSIQTTEDYYTSSASSPMTTTPLHKEFQQLTTESQAVDNVAKLPLAQSNLTATGPYIQDPTEVSIDTTGRMPPQLQHEVKVPGITTAEPSKTLVEEHSDIIFHLPDSSSGVGSGSGQYNSPTDHSGIGFEFTDTSSGYPASTGRPSHEPSPEESTESGSTSDTDIPQSDAPPADNSNLQDSTAETAPLYDLGYANISETSPLSPPTPSDVTLAFAMVEQPEGSVKPHHLPSSEPQLDSGSIFEPNPGYVNSCTATSGCGSQFTSSYTAELTTPDYVAESSIGNLWIGGPSAGSEYVRELSEGKSSSGYVGEMGKGESSSEYVGDPEECQVDYGSLWCSTNTSSNDDSKSPDPSSQQPNSPYISESDLRHVTTVHNSLSPIFRPLPNDLAKLLGNSHQPTTSNHKPQSADDFSL